MADAVVRGVQVIDYAELKLEVDALVEEFGAVAYLRRASTATYNTTTGAVADSVAADETVKAVVANYDESKIDGTIIRRGDMRALVSCVGLSAPPSVNDVLVWGTELFTVVNLNIVSPARTDVLYDLQVRK